MPRRKLAGGQETTGYSQNTIHRTIPAAGTVGRSQMPPTGQTPRAMTVDQARQVLWLGNVARYHRPLGELIDEGYLNEARLQWAASYAYDNNLKQAATVLLASRRHAKAPVPSPDVLVTANATQLKLALTLEQARATSWPFGQLKGQPMGDLIDGGRIGMRDLGFAVEHAWDRRVRDAAIALLAIRLNQAAVEPVGHGPLKVVSGGKSYSQNKELGWTMLLGAFYGAVGLGWLLIAAYVVRSAIRNPASFLPKLTPVTTSAGTIPVAFIVALLAGVLALEWWLINCLMALPDRMQGQIDRARKGQEGEEALEEVLRQNLDGAWTLFRNLTLPGRNPADIDGVLVGPSGVWALEAKNFSGGYRNFGEHWEYKAGRHWKLYKKSPSRQARRNAIRLAEFLKADGLKQFVSPAVVWLNPTRSPLIEHPQVPVWTWDRLPEELGNLWQGAVVDEEHNRRIVEKLSDLCRRNAAKDKKARR